MKETAPTSRANLASTNGCKNGSNVVGLKEPGQGEDASLLVKVQGAGIEPFELQAHGFWLVQDMVLAVLAREEVAPRTCFSLSMSGATLDPLSELKAVKGLKSGTTLRLIEEPYIPRTARFHLARLQELLRAPGSQDALKEGRSPSVLDTLSLTTSIESAPGVHSGRGARRSVKDAKPEQPTLEGPPPEFIVPGSQERPLLPLLPNASHTEATSCLSDLSISCWNPPPGARKLQGDFMYITVCTLEGLRCDITSCPRGFYVNKSTLGVFDPRPASSSSPTHCLTDLLSQISPEFKKGFNALKSRSHAPPLESMPTPYRTLSWLGPTSAVRSHRNSFSGRLGLEEHAETQAPDWNEELQAARDLPKGDLEQRLLRDRALLQVNSAFVWAAAQATEAVIDGCVPPVNGGGEDPAFLWGGFFLSWGGDGGGAGERGRRAAQRLELKGVQAYSELEGGLQSLHTLPTAVVDYRGSRLSVQGLAPGMEGPDWGPEGQGTTRGLLYGLAASPQEGTHRRKLLELLAQAAKVLALQRHNVMNPSGYAVPLFTPKDTQGLLGGDGRFYLLDLFRVQPVDANFQLAEKEGEDSGEVNTQGPELEGCPSSSRESTAFPRCFPHGLCQLRPELKQAFIQHKSSQFSKRLRERMEENGGVEECVKTGDPRGTEAVRGACKDVGSVSDIIFEMRFNPDVFCPGVKFPSSDSSAILLQQRLLREAAAFIITEQIPAFVDDCLQFRVSPMDGATLCQAMHQKGINIRYLGQVAHVISQSEQKEQLKHITRLLFGEIVVRSARRIFNTFLQGVEVSSLSAAVSHFLCCLLVPHFSSNPLGEEPKKRSRRRGRGGGVAVSDSMAWSTLSGAELWSLISKDAKETYNPTDGLGTSIDQLVEQYGIQKVSLLRELCIKTGIQLRLREYNLENCSKAPVGPDDILNMFPVVKHIAMTTTDASRTFQSAQKSIQKGNIEQAYEQLKEAAYLFGRVCDDLHPEACACLSSLARLAYLQEKTAEARSLQLRAVVISERVLGFDHPNTIQEYALLAVYVFAGGELGLAKRCLYRAKLLMLLVHGEEHPYTATLDSSLGLVLQGEHSLHFLQSALRLNTLFRGPIDLQTALSHHLLAQRMCSVGDYRGAMTHEREALTIFQTKCGEEHHQTRCSSDFLRSITQQAVRVERSLRQGGADTAPPESLTPSLETTLEQLALVNGILRVSIRNKINEFKEKLKEQGASVGTEHETAEPGATMNGEVVPNSPFGQDNVAGKDVLNEGAVNGEERTHHLEEVCPDEKTKAEKKACDTLGGASSTAETDDKESANDFNGEAGSLAAKDPSEPAEINGEWSLAVDDRSEAGSETPAADDGSASAEIGGGESLTTNDESRSAEIDTGASAGND